MFDDLHHRARALSLEERHSEALPLWLELVALRSQHLGMGHLEALRAWRWLANTYFELGELERAAEIYEELVPGFAKRVGESHDLYQGTVRWYADTLYLLERFEESWTLYEQIVPEYEARYGPGHDFTLCAKHWMAKNALGLGQVALCESLCAEVWPLVREVYGLEGSFALEHLGWWASALGLLGRLEEEAQMEWGIVRARLALGHRGEALAWAIENLRDTLEQLGEEWSLRELDVLQVELGVKPVQ